MLEAALALADGRPARQEVAVEVPGPSVRADDLRERDRPNADGAKLERAEAPLVPVERPQRADAAPARDPSQNATRRARGTVVVSISRAE